MAAAGPPGGLGPMGYTARQVIAPPTSRSHASESGPLYMLASPPNTSITRRVGSSAEAWEQRLDGPDPSVGIGCHEASGADSDRLNRSRVVFQFVSPPNASTRSSAASYTAVWSERTGTETTDHSDSAEASVPGDGIAGREDRARGSSFRRRAGVPGSKPSSTRASC